eukprot:1097702-Pleurochrysis_carterae.AAC.19
MERGGEMVADLLESHCRTYVAPSCNTFDTRDPFCVTAQLVHRFLEQPPKSQCNTATSRPFGQYIARPIHKHRSRASTNVQQSCAHGVAEGLWSRTCPLFAIVTFWLQSRCKLHVSMHALTVAERHDIA